MAIEVISTLKPKNNGDFFVAEAQNIGVDGIPLSDKLASMGNGGGSGAYVLDLTNRLDNEGRGEITEDEYAALVANAPNVIVAFENAFGTMGATYEGAFIFRAIFKQEDEFDNNGDNCVRIAFASFVVLPDRSCRIALEEIDFPLKEYVDSCSAFTLAYAEFDILLGDDNDTEHSGTLEILQGSLETAVANPCSLVIFLKDLNIPATYSHLKELDGGGFAAVYKGKVAGEDGNYTEFFVDVKQDGTYRSYIDSLNALYPMNLVVLKRQSYENPVVTEETITYSLSSGSEHVDYQRLTTTHLLFGSGYVIPYTHSVYNIDVIIGDGATQKQSGEVMFYGKSTIQLSGDGVVIKLNGETNTNKIIELLGGSIRWCRLSV